MNSTLSKSEQLEKIKAFRESTGYSLSDCKSVLEKTNFDTAAAKEILAKKYADKYATLANSDDVEAPEFVTKVFYDPINSIFGYCAVRSKSDMVTRSEQMRDLLSKAFDALDHEERPEEDGFKHALTFSPFKSMYDDILGYFREPIKFEKIKKKKLTSGEVFANYAHTIYHKNEGDMQFTVAKSSAPIVLKYEGNLDEEGIEKIRKLAYSISMTIIGSNKAKVFSKDELDPKVLEDFRNARIEEAKKAGKPEAAIEKIVSGQLNKFYQENLITHLSLISTSSTPWLKPSNDGDVTVEDAIKQTENLLGCKISVSFYKVLTDK
jgi:elongation factor Ts